MMHLSAQVLLLFLPTVLAEQGWEEMGAVGRQELVTVLLMPSAS